MNSSGTMTIHIQKKSFNSTLCSKPYILSVCSLIMFSESWDMDVIDVLFKAEHSTVTYHHFDQLRVSAVTDVHCKKETSLTNAESNINC